MNNKNTSRQMCKEERLETLLAHLEQLLPDITQRAAFRQGMLTPPPTCLRLNPLMHPAANLRQILADQNHQVPWCADAFVLSDCSKPLGLALEHLLGAFYIQAKATTLATTALNPQPGETVLDMAAAPGGKATHIAAAMRNTGLLVVNEPQRKRLPSLVGNLERCGVSNTIVIQASGALLGRYFHNYFDRVLLDAPCSGDGILCKNQALLNYWSPEDACHRGQQQAGLLRAAFHTLKPGGTLVYSTCSLSLEENEEVLLALLKRYPDLVEILPIEGIAPTPLPTELAAKYPPEFAHCRRVWPHLHNTEGAFVAKIRKSGETTWPKTESDANLWETPPNTDTTDERQYLETQWQFTLPIPDGQILRRHRRHLYLQPHLTAAFQTHLPFYVRSGMRVARQHKTHYYLTNQSATLWGHTMQRPHLELSWPQVQQLFHGEALHFDEPLPLKGEFLCRFGPWSICRAQINSNGNEITGMLPQELHRRELHKLT